jgi:hypothetical protein
MTAVIRSIIIREESTPSKTIVINRGPRGTSAALEEYSTLTETFNLTSSDIANKKILLSYSPVNDNVTVIVDGAGSQSIFNVDFILNNGNEVTWAGLRLESILDDSDTVYVSYLVKS